MFNLFRGVNPINSSGVLDVIVIQDEQNELKSSQFLIRIGKAKVW